MNKYNAERVYYSFSTGKESTQETYKLHGGIAFDSRLEYKVYQELLKHIDRDTLDVHPSYDCGESISFSFRPDFAFMYSKKTLIVEAKGFITESFPFRLYLFLKAYPWFQGKYFLVLASPQKLEKVLSNSIVKQLNNAGWIKCVTINGLKTIFRTEVEDVFVL
jgi:hypothetical protein